MRAGINDIIQKLTERGSQLATSRLEERRVKYLNIINLIMILWLFSMGLMRLAIGDTMLVALNWTLALICIAIYYRHNIDLKSPKIMLIFLGQIAVASQIVISLDAGLLPHQHLKISLIVLSFFILIFFDGYLMYLFYSLNVVLFYSPYVFMEEFNPFPLLHGTYLFIAPFFVVKGFMQDIQFYEKELSCQKEQLENQSKILKQNHKLKTRFFTNITHEFRTPLTLILGHLKELKETESIQNPQNIYLIEKHAAQLLALVNQILDLSKAQYGFKKLNLSSGCISDFIKSLCSVFESHSKNKGITFIGNFPKEPIYGFADMESLEKILYNLISNAFKFTEKNNKIKVSLRLLHEEYRCIEMQVVDTGKGIEEDELSIIFEQYYHTRTGSEVSSGIGLALVKELVDNHKGNITVSSEVGVGTRFTLKISIDEQFYINQGVEYDIAEAKNSPMLRDMIRYNINGNSKTGETLSPNEKTAIETILLVEDNEDMRKYLQQILPEIYQLIIAKNGQEGIDIATKMTPDIIISDVMMPVKSGIELTNELKQNITTSHIPVILLTAKSSIDSKIEGYEADADDYIVKPFDKKELLCRIHNLIRSRKQLQQKYNDSSMPPLEEVRELSIEDKFIKNLTEIIYDNIDNTDFTVEQLSKEIGVSRSQLYRKIYALTGLSISQFIRTKRLNYGYKLLKKNTGTVSEIAYKVGFSSPNYFNKCFKKMFNVCPGDVRSN